MGTQPPPDAGIEPDGAPAFADNDHQLLSATEYEQAFGADEPVEPGSRPQGEPGDFLEQLDDAELVAWAKESGYETPEQALKALRDTKSYMGERSGEVNELRQNNEQMARELAELKGMIQAQQGQQQNGQAETDITKADIPGYLAERLNEINEAAIKVSEENPDMQVGALSKALADTQRTLMDGVRLMDQQSQARQQQLYDEIATTQIQPLLQGQREATNREVFQQQIAKYGRDDVVAMKDDVEAFLRENPSIATEANALDVAYRAVYADRARAQAQQQANLLNASTMGAGAPGPPPDDRSPADRAVDEMMALANQEIDRGSL